jgi:hypothetical protein
VIKSIDRRSQSVVARCALLSKSIRSKLAQMRRADAVAVALKILCSPIASSSGHTAAPCVPDIARNMSEPAQAAPLHHDVRAASVATCGLIRTQKIGCTRHTAAEAWLTNTGFDGELIKNTARPVKVGSAEHDVKVLLCDKCHGLDSAA